MLPILILVGLGGLLAWSVREKHTGVAGALVPMGAASPTALVDAKVPTGFLGPPLQPEEERLLTLLILWARDKQFAVGRKRFMTAGLARELCRIAERLGLAGTVRAVLTDGPIPEPEMFGRRGISVRQAIVLYARAQRGS